MLGEGEKEREIRLVMSALGASQGPQQRMRATICASVDTTGWYYGRTMEHLMPSVIPRPRLEEKLSHAYVFSCGIVNLKHLPHLTE